MFEVWSNVVEQLEEDHSSCEDIPHKLTQQARKPQQKVASTLQVRLLWILRTFLWSSLLVVGLILLIQQIIKVSQVNTDFCQDYVAAQRLLQGAFVYQPVHCWPGYANTPPPVEFDAHPPSSVIFFLPFAFLPKVTSALLWGLASLAAYLLSGWVLFSILEWRKLPSMALFIGGSIYWTPFTGAEQAQNLAELLTLFIILAWLLDRQGRTVLSGCLLGLGGVLKLWPVILLSERSIRGRWREVLAGGMMLIAGNVLGLILLGVNAFTTYFGPVQAIESYSVPNVGNVSLVGLIARLLTGDHFALPPLGPQVDLGPAVLIGEAATILFFLGVLVCLWRWSRHTKDNANMLLSQAILTTSTMVVFPLTWQWELITLLVPGAMLVLALRQLPRPPLWWFALLGASLLPLLFPYEVIILVQGMVEHHQSTLQIWKEQAIVSLPTCGLLLFSGAQALLLSWAWKQERMASSYQ